VHETDLRAKLSFMTWNLTLGDTTTRDQNASRYGGSKFGGIEPAHASGNLFIYSDPAAGTEFGYDFDGWIEAEGVFRYTGDGQVGDQQLTGDSQLIRSTSWTAATIAIPGQGRTPNDCPRGEGTGAMGCYGTSTRTATQGPPFPCAAMRCYTMQQSGALCQTTGVSRGSTSRRVEPVSLLLFGATGCRPPLQHDPGRGATSSRVCTEGTELHEGLSAPEHRHKLDDHFGALTDWNETTQRCAASR
jgi:hypothetical protein